MRTSLPARVDVACEHVYVASNSTWMLDGIACVTGVPCDPNGR